jgi:hypothetical protein
MFGHNTSSDLEMADVKENGGVKISPMVILENDHMEQSREEVEAVIEGLEMGE